MQIVNETGLKVAWTAWQVRPPQESLVLVLKGVFKIAPERPAEILPDDDAALPSGDLFTDEDPARDLAYANDFAPYKPRADLLLSATCRTPGGSPSQTCRVSFGVGAWRKSLDVHGDRYWVGDGSRWQVSPAQPFTEMPLGYEAAFGGPGFAANPVGKGIEARRDPSGRQVIALPNLERPGQTIRSPEDRPTPAGFGPISPSWLPRSRTGGTYDAVWQKNRWPYFPDDFDWSHFNAAPPDQRPDGYLRGDEQLTFENLHPETPVYRTALPGLRARCFVVENTDEQEKFREVPVQLDTLSVDLDRERLVLVWRGLTPIRDREHRELSQVYLAAEPLSEAPGTPEAHLQSFVALREAAASEFALEEEEAPASDSEAPAAAPPSEAEVGAEIAKAMSEARSTLLEAGVAPEVLDSIAGETDPQAILRKLLPDSDDLVAPAEGAGTDDRAKVSEMFLTAGYDPAIMEMLDNPQSPAGLQAAFAGLRAFLASQGQDVAGLDEVERDAKQAAAEAAADAKPAAEFAGRNLSGWDFSGQDLAGQSFAQSDLSGANFSGANLKQTDFTGAILTDADLGEADLEAADLTGATLAGARLIRAVLRGAKLVEADATKARLDHADLGGADMTAAILTEASLTVANLENAIATGAVLDQADLSEADLSGGDFTGVDLSGCTLTRARLDGACLREASVEGATGENVSMVKADLTELHAAEGCSFNEGDFTEVHAPGAIWIDAQLKGANFSFAQMAGANFTGADLTDSNCHAIELSNGNLSKAKLSRARLTNANLFRVRLEKAELSETDFRGSNMYEAEFFEATGSKPRFEGANLKMTKLAAPEAAS